MRAFAQWNGSSLVIVERERWKRQRRLVQAAFQSRRFAAYSEKMAVGIEALTETLNKQINEQGHVDIGIDKTMVALTLDINCQSMFSTNLKSQISEISRAVATLSEIAFFELQSLFIWPRWLPTSWNRRKDEAIRVLDETVWSLVRQRRRENVDKGDLLSMLLAAVDDEGDGGSLTDEQVRNEVITLNSGWS